MKKGIALVLLLALILTACGAEKPATVSSTEVLSTSVEAKETADAKEEATKKDLGGQYNIEELLTLLKPMLESLEKKLEYITEDDLPAASKEVVDEGLRELGFIGGEEIILTGKLGLILMGTDQDYGALYINTKDGSESLPFTIKKEILRNLVLVEEGSNVKIEFTVKESDEAGHLDFMDVDILYPSAPEYAPDCNIEGESETLIMGKVVEGYSVNMTKEEANEICDKIAKDVENFDINLYTWYLNSPRFTHFFVVEDELGNRAGVFLNDRFSEIPEVGNKVGIRGQVKQVETEMFAGKYLDTTIGSIYIFNN